MGVATTARAINPRYQSLDVWRGLACLMVVLDHASIPALGVDALQFQLHPTGTFLQSLVMRATSLALGPPMFFVISGYCIAASVDSLRRKGKAPAEFLLKRLWRTYPPYWVALGVFVVVIAALDFLGQRWIHSGPYGYEIASPATLTWSQWLGNLTLTETWRPAVLGDRSGQILTRVAWSLCYQEQFYVICFLAVLLAPRHLFKVLAGASLLIIGTRLALADSGRIDQLNGFFPMYWHEFAVGLVVYWRINQAPDALSRRLVDIGLLALIGIAFANQASETAVAAGYGLLLVAIRPWDARLAETRWLAPVRACGKRCYSIYLTHMLVCSIGAMALVHAGLSGFWARAFVVVPALIGVSLAVSWLFYDLVESRFRDTTPVIRRPGPERWVDPAPELSQSAAIRIVA
jgi:peptidoglycan/LPS O-acetylase OafA/YrhL